MTYTESQKKIGANTNLIYIPEGVADELFKPSWGELVNQKANVYIENRNQLDNLTRNSYKLPIGSIELNEKSKLLISLESYTSFEEAWNLDQNSPADIPVKLVLQYSIPSSEYSIPESFSRKKDRQSKNIELENLLHYTLVKIPLTQYLDFIKSGDYSKFKESTVNV